MAFSRFIILLILSVTCYASNVPVFMWGDLERTSQKSNPLSTISRSEFSNIVEQELVDEPFLVVFVEETLSVEDFSRKNQDGETSFPYLHDNLKDSLYLPNVQNALNALNKLADPAKAEHVKLTENGLSAEIVKDDSRVLFINLKDAREGESRWDLLRRHNDFMEEMVSNLNKHYKVMACYTAHFPSWTIPEIHSRSRRQASDVTPGDYSFDGLKLYVKNFMLNDGITATNLGIPTATSDFNSTTMNTTLSFPTTKLTLNFHQAGGYWFFDTVTLQVTSPEVITETLYATSEVFALMDFSYRCLENVSYTSINETKQYTLTFQNFKVQPFFQNTTGPLVFGDSFNCVGFFTAPIWAGLFVVFILLAITFYGIMMMMDIRTMDRFDDPKGKTITINASE
ncbi:hypothetical protein K1T71_014587 [Dendrolimus kikuchii]|uniref:Uncharacterized protein n=1 Tax=Dendrolimus kikuchii TaxID=765133 RepID=A0ACC1CEH4_9NEOP|nr:hypothetical protein K1T71_014587 [Dendrolimus kikuchii]